MNIKKLFEQVNLLYWCSDGSDKENSEAFLELFRNEIHIIRRYLIDNKTEVKVRYHNGTLKNGIIIGLIVTRMSSNIKVAVRLMTDDGVYTIEASEIIY
ncbi:hypothetical protein GNZ01_06940 [Escherichia coli]|uniref:Mononegavirus-type SAM-dependent 2'-O-MTase domain-containing protein n=2 Tax=root TaxID=1 RepID=A0AAJ2Y2Y2_ECOLX|nr:hypothetical protein [Escherichia coli]MED6572889.1 hypothetical protein [Escherichia coli O157]QDF13992.1 hypothetical protein vBEcoMphAPEC6_gp368c [Escherichia phage vB_EcoM_phAPEC6]BBM62009.1 hypothetical protein EO157G_4200 [Escherichia phage SP27]EFF2106049.1 hypothetical protein [Escherichia coli]EKR8628525.1 hypothetical protein [Escherichia coli]